jgi:TPR repeat protein
LNFRIYIKALRAFLALGAMLPLAAGANDLAEPIEQLLNSRSAGSPHAYAKAAKQVAQAAKDGRPLQKYIIALISREADAPPAARITDAERERYFAESRPTIRRLAESRGNPLAWYLLSVDTGDTNMLKRAADGNNVQALNAWGNYLLDRALNAPQIDHARVSEAVACFRLAAGQGDANGSYNLGMAYARGLGMPRDDARAFACFRSAAEKGHPEAINSMGWFFREGRVFSKDLELAAKWFEKSASYGNPYGQLNWGLALQRGEGVAPDAARAAEQFRRSAEGGCIEAMTAYGVALARGDGVDADEESAVRWFMKAAAAGYPPAMENLAECYASGRGVAADNRKSLEWKFRSRAARGDKAAADWLKQNVK